MKNLNIDWLHNPIKEGRRSGRTTEMLSSVVGIAQLSNDTSHVMVVCSDSMWMMQKFIDVLRLIDPDAKYHKAIRLGLPSVSVMSEYGALCDVMFSSRNFEHWANGLKNAYQVIDHHFAEMAIRRNNDFLDMDATKSETRRNIHGMGTLEWWMDI